MKWTGDILYCPPAFFQVVYYFEMKHLLYNTKDTCSKAIDITIDDNGIIEQVVFFGGCHGNLQGISRLVKGMHVNNVIEKLKGVKCGNKWTSCPDQLALALEKIKTEEF